MIVIITERFIDMETESDLPDGMYKYEYEGSVPRIDPPKGILDELERMEDQPRKKWFDRQMKIKNQKISEEVNYGENQYD